MAYRELWQEKRVRTSTRELCWRRTLFADCICAPLAAVKAFVDTRGEGGRQPTHCFGPRAYGCLRDSRRQKQQSEVTVGNN